MIVEKWSPKTQKDDLFQDMKNLTKLDGEFVDVGWFESQGEHSTANMTYAELGNVQATGDGGRFIRRDVLGVATSLYQINNPRVNSAIDKFLDNPTQAGIDTLLEAVGKDQRDYVKSLFGTAVLHQTVNNPDPLINTGEWKSKTAYKTNRGTVRER